MNVTLVVEADEEWTGPSETLAGHRWHISRDHNVENTIYHCVSYTWGTARSANLFGIAGNVSSRTRGALEAAILSTSSDDSVRHKAFWIDAVCVPTEELARRATLESMGNIYSRAQSTIVVLQSASWAIISRDARSNVPYMESQMDHLNQDAWVTRVWTYQELVNAQDLFFTAVDLPPGTRISDEDLLNSIGLTLRRYMVHNQLPALESRRRFPALDALESALGDRQIGFPLERSMLTCLTAIAGRDYDPAWPASRLYALLGALTQEPSWGPVDETVAALAEKAMRICEGKGDFSYIYTSDRRQVEEQRWRPRPDAGLHPIVRWNSWGERQPGASADGKLELHDMVRLDPDVETSPEPVAHALRWLRGFTNLNEEALSGIDALERDLPQALREIGFTGSADCHRCKTGVMLTQEEVEVAEGIERTYQPASDGRLGPRVSRG